MPAVARTRGRGAAPVAGVLERVLQGYVFFGDRRGREARARDVRDGLDGLDGGWWGGGDFGLQGWGVMVGVFEDAFWRLVGACEMRWN
jgi:hypothetical protein